ncbi:MAG: hypothetical protein ABIH67_01675 [Candidatus Uhrbacteria bacterium]
MDKIAKALCKLSTKEKKMVKSALLKVKLGQVTGLDVKKLKNRDDIYRVRKGDLRILFHRTKDSIKILALERRIDTTYKK